MKSIPVKGEDLIFQSIPVNESYRQDPNNRILHQNPSDFNISIQDQSENPLMNRGINRYKQRFDSQLTARNQNNQSLKTIDS